MTELFTNNAASTLASGISAVATACTVQTGHGVKFPNPSSPDFYRITFFKESTGEIEIAYCTTRSGDGMTVITRGEEGTTPLILLAGDVVENRTTAGFFTSLTVTDSRVQNNYYKQATETGSIDVYAITPTPAITAYAKGQEFWFIPTNNNIGASTLGVSGVATPPDIKLIDGSDPYADALSTTQIAHVIHDGTNYVLQNPVVQNNSITLMAAANYAAMRALLNAAHLTGVNVFTDSNSFTSDLNLEAATLTGEYPLKFEGGSPDPYETKFKIIDPTAIDKTITFKDETGTVAFLSDITALGSPASRTENTIYQASTDGFFVGVLNVTGTDELGVTEINGWADGSTPPTTLMGGNAVTSHDNAQYANNQNISFMIPVKKDDYYKGNYNDIVSGITTTRTYYWMPLS